MLDRQDIHDCLVNFCRGMDRFDREIYLSAFHDDAVVAAGPFVGNAADCYDWAMPMHEQGQISTQHIILNVSYDIDDSTLHTGTAHTETYYQFVARNRDDSNWVAGGRYIDRFEKRDGQWKIALRTNIIEWSGTLPTMPLPFGDVPDILANGAASRDRSDPSYSRPLMNKRELKNPS